MECETTPNDIVLGTAIRISRIEYEKDPKRFEYYYHDLLYRNLIEFISQSKVQTIEEEGYIEKRVDLYVATPSQFWTIVNTEAQKLADLYYSKGEPL